eukprot:5882608-Heterocapsa_arctica.AAC.1
MPSGSNLLECKSTCRGLSPSGGLFRRSRIFLVPHLPHVDKRHEEILGNQPPESCDPSESQPGP